MPTRRAPFAIAALAASMVVAIAARSPYAAQPPEQGVPSPAAHFGFAMGADRQLAAADDIDRYFELVAARSDRVRIVDLGPTSEHHRTIAAIVSAPENIRNLDEIRRTNERLGDPRTLAPDEARRLSATQKVVVAIGCSIHATEVGATQAANQLLYELATSDDKTTLEQLRNIVLVLIPMLNPDGHRIVVDWYEKYRNTRYDGGPMPWADHPYAGHDINRDAFMMNLAESRNLARFFYTSWHPQVFLTMHQMESDGPRFFAPPNDDPIQTNYDPLIWREAGLLGSAMTFELEREQKSGVVSNAMYDYYWPGYEDSAPLGHNTVCLLTEAARVRVATPIDVPARDLRGAVKGLLEYRPQINFPHPWPGGSWTLRDIVEYDLGAVHGLLRAASAYHADIVQNFYDMGRRAVQLGARGGPFAYAIAAEQHDPTAAAKLEALLLDAGVEIHRAVEPFRGDDMKFPAGTDVILLAQPYRAYVKTLIERQQYPGRHAPADTSSDRPYDVAGWTLPAQMGVDVSTIERPFETSSMSRLMRAAIAPAAIGGDARPSYYVVDARGDGGAIAANRLLGAGLKPFWTTRARTVNGDPFAAGSLVVEGSPSAATIVNAIAADLGLRVDGVAGALPSSLAPLARARVAVYKPWIENTDEGWTRWVLEQYGFPFTSVANGDIRAGHLRARFDVVVLPSMTAELILHGQSSDVVPPPYAGGVGDEGVAALVAFVRAGGTLVALDQATSLAIAAFRLPIHDVAHDGHDRVFCPGSILRVDVDPEQPLAYGMARRTAGVFAFSSAYEVLAARPPAERGAPAPPPLGRIATVARYADRDLLVSGWLEGEPVIAGRAAALDVQVGAGRVVLLGFRVQHRGQSLATFRLLFNALLTVRDNK